MTGTSRVRPRPEQTTTRPAPKARDPVSPMKMVLGLMFHHRRPPIDPARVLSLDELGSERTFEAGGTASGLGDVIVRGKGEIFRRGSQGFTGGLDLRLPTGDERNLLGSGAWGVRPFFAYSGASGRVSPHVNVAYLWNGASVLAGNPATGEKGDVPDQFQYAIGADLGVNDRFSITGDWISRLSIDSPRVRLVSETISGTYGSVTLQDIAFERSSFWASSAAIGCKMNAKGRLLVDFNLRFTVTDNGLTDRVTPLIGLEYTF